MESRIQRCFRLPCPSWPGEPARNEGVALVFVLWITVLLSAVALSVKFSTHLRSQIAATSGRTTKAFFLARAGVERAIADLVEDVNEVPTQERLRENSERTYRNLELGGGTYTLYAGMEDGDPVYGIMDEGAKLNLNQADADMLGGLPGMDPNLADTVVAFREGRSYHDVDDLLLLEGVDVLKLYGEDQNRNGLLDPNEDDGEASWPPDDADGTLDTGCAAYLTVWSAARDVAYEGKARVKLNEASAESIQEDVKGITSQQAESIVAHRDKNKFTSIADLLDVELVEKTTNSGGQKPPGQPQGKPPNQEGQSQADGQPEQQAENGKNAGEEAEKPQKKEESPPKQQPEENNNTTETKGTGAKAFAMEDFRKFADAFTLAEEEVLKGVVNINTAPAAVLACLPGIDEGVALAIVQERQGRPEGFTTVADLLDVNGLTIKIFKQVSGLVSARSDVFQVRSFGVVDDGDIYACVSAVIDRTEDEAHILYWQEYE